jgi:glycosyltransferase involved in cell wall biosynthesis
MRVFYYGLYENYGGLENFAHNLILNLRKKGVEFSLLTPANPVAFENDFEKQGCLIERLPNFKKHPFAYYRKFCKILSKAKPGDVVQLNICSYRNFLPFLACKKTHIKPIVVGHFANVADGHAPWMHYLNKNLFSRIGIKITMTDDITRFMFTKKSCPLKILNGIDTTRFSFSQTDRENIRATFHFGEDVSIGQIARITPEKNPMFAVKVMEKIHRDYPRVVLHLVGRELDPSIRRYVSEGGLSSFVIFDGEQKKDIQKWYSAFDILLLPSPKEGLSLALLEAASNGIALVASSAVPRLDCETPNIAYLDLDADKWAAHIEKLIVSLPKRLNQIKGTPYDIEVCANHYLDVYKNFEAFYEKNR